MKTLNAEEKLFENEQFTEFYDDHLVSIIFSDQVEFMIYISYENIRYRGKVLNMSRSKM